MKPQGLLGFLLINILKLLGFLTKYKCEWLGTLWFMVHLFHTIYI